MAATTFTLSDTATSLAGFGIDNLRDLYRSLVANPTAPRTGSTLTRDEALTLVVQVGTALVAHEALGGYDLAQAQHDEADAAAEAYAEGAWLRAAESTEYPCYCGQGEGGICC